MKSIPETIIGKPVSKWTNRDLKLLRISICALGVGLWLFLFLMIEMLHSEWIISWGLVIVAAVVYVSILFGLVFHALPSGIVKNGGPIQVQSKSLPQDQERSTRRKSVSQSLIVEYISAIQKMAGGIIRQFQIGFGKRSSQKSVGVMVLSCLEVVGGSIGVIIFLMLMRSLLAYHGTLFHPRPHLAGFIGVWTWPLISVLMILGGAMGLLRQRMGWLIDLSVQPLVIFAVTMTLLPFVLKSLFRHDHILLKIGPLFLLFSVWSCCALIIYFLSRPSSREHFGLIPTPTQDQTLPPT